MKHALFAIAAAAALLAGPALADTPTPASPTTSLNALLAAGYQVAAINDISDAEQKSIWPNDAIEPYIMVTLQKSGSVAVCTMIMANWISVSAKTFADTTLCHQR